MSYTIEDYREAASRLWGEAGAYAVDSFVRLNDIYFAGALPPLPIVIGITAYGHCIGLTRHHALPRISLACWAFRSTRSVDDVLLHEMVHAELILAGLDSKHNAQPWCDRIVELSPMVVGRTIQAQPVKTKRKGKRVLRYVEEGYLTQKELARWPDCLRSPDYYSEAAGISVDTY